MWCWYSHALGSQLLGAAVCLTSSLSSSSKRADCILYMALSFRFSGYRWAPLSHSSVEGLWVCCLFPLGMFDWFMFQEIMQLVSAVGTVMLGRRCLCLSSLVGKDGTWWWFGEELMKLWWGRALSPFVATILSWDSALTQNQVRRKVCDVSGIWAGRSLHITFKSAEECSKLG